MEDKIKEKLQLALSPNTLKITDQSHLHIGHANGPKNGERGTHFKVQIVSVKFQDLSKVARHKLVYKALAQEFTKGLHALALETKTPEEVK